MQPVFRNSAYLADNASIYYASLSTHLSCELHLAGSLDSRHILTLFLRHNLPSACVHRVEKEFCIDELMRDMTSDHQDAFYVVDLSVVMHKLNKWRELLPRVKPFYAVKCNNDQAICRMLATAGELAPQRSYFSLGRPCQLVFTDFFAILPRALPLA